jgi:hypothetical protein
MLFDWFDNNLAVFWIATYATHVNNDVSKHILFDWLDNDCTFESLRCPLLAYVVNPLQHLAKLLSYWIHLNNYIMLMFTCVA